MTDFSTIIKSRRSIRKFTDQPVTDEELFTVFEAVQYAQSWNNTQCWELVIIKNAAVRKELQKTVPSTNPGYRAITDAPVLIAMVGKTKLSGYFGTDPGSVLGDWYMHDLGIATQNLCSQAHAIGLGSVVVGWMEHEKAGEILEVPDGYQLVSLIPLGHPGQKGKSPTRKPVSDFVHYNRFEAKEC